jgi:LPPG:FO 2-phospho-L-lactate transferase
MALDRVVALAGGVGGAKLALGLAKVLLPEQLTIVVNTGDDFVHQGLAISPDLDTVMYTLAGIVNPESGWGVSGDTTQMLEMLSKYGETPWFKLGDRDLATHLLRTKWLSDGYTLADITARLSAALGVEHRVLPMSNSPVQTMVNTEEYGWLEFQEYFVRHRWQPVAIDVEYRQAEQAAMPGEVRVALSEADLVVICPSNPLLSIAPILAVSGFRQMLGAKPCIAVSPIIAGDAVKGPAAKMMRELSWPVTAEAVAGYYSGLLDGFVLDSRDKDHFEDADFGCQLLVTDTIMKNDQDKIRLAQELLGWAEGFVT